MLSYTATTTTYIYFILENLMHLAFCLVILAIAIVCNQVVIQIASSVFLSFQQTVFTILGSITSWFLFVFIWFKAKLKSYNLLHVLIVLSRKLFFFGNIIKNWRSKISVNWKCLTYQLLTSKHIVIYICLEVYIQRS